MEHPFNMKGFDSVEPQINNMFAEIRELRRISERKLDIDEFHRLQNNYLELLRDFVELKQWLAA